MNIRVRATVETVLIFGILVGAARFLAAHDGLSEAEGGVQMAVLYGLVAGWFPAPFWVWRVYR